MHVIDQEKCIKCGTCLELCPAKFGAVVKVSGEKVEVPREPIPVKPIKPAKEEEKKPDTEEADDG